MSTQAINDMYERLLNMYSREELTEEIRWAQISAGQNEAKTITDLYYQTFNVAGERYG